MLQKLRLQVLQMRLTKSSTATTDHEHSNANAVAEEMGVLLATHAQNRTIPPKTVIVAEEMTVSSATITYTEPKPGLENLTVDKSQDY